MTRFFTRERLALEREVEGDWDRNHPDEPPRLNDPPEVDRICGDCERFNSLFNFCWKRSSSALADDEACEEWEGEE
jgi:hypothetical protein